MKPELSDTLDNLPADTPRSRLDPFRSFILKWRREGRSYRRIQQILAAQCGVTVTHETLRRFIQRRSRPRTPQPELEPEPMAATPAARPQNELTFKRTDGGSDPYAEVRARMARDKATPVPPKPVKLFEDPEENSIKPIIYLPTKKEN